jgi:hypothetical protein
MNVRKICNGDRFVEDKTNINYQTEVTWWQTTGLYTKTNHTILKGINRK